MRDIVSGLVVLALVAWGEPRWVGIVLAIEAIIPVGDMSIILAIRGSSQKAFGIYGLTAALMLFAATPFVMGVA